MCCTHPPPTAWLRPLTGVRSNGFGTFRVHVIRLQQGATVSMQSFSRDEGRYSGDPPGLLPSTSLAVSLPPCSLLASASV